MPLFDEDNVETQTLNRCPDVCRKHKDRSPRKHRISIVPTFGVSRMCRGVEAKYDRDVDPSGACVYPPPHQVSLYQEERSGTRRR